MKTISEKHQLSLALATILKLGEDNFCAETALECLKKYYTDAEIERLKKLV